MKLSYRGIKYNQESTLVNVRSGVVSGKYRGADWQSHDLEQLALKQSHPHLTYRGVSYH
ncbi:hypothetical protein Xen7305DRAFT_00003580 [Xenococcus sp. PCC 7305]|nr:hypothetical protein Xen7305DRAFT_00003580 [Xenococcus sp. PCC 7305]